MLWRQLKQIIFSPIFAISCMIFYLLLMLEEVQLYTNVEVIRQGLLETAVEQQIKTTTILDLLTDRLSYGFTGVFCCIAVVLPTVWYRSEDWEGETYYYILRSGKKNYLVAQIASAILSSMLVSGIVLLLYCGTLSLMGYRLGPPRTIELFVDPLLIFFAEKNWHFMIVACYILTRMLFSAICCMISLTLSTFFSDRYILVGTPYLYYMALAIFTQTTGTSKYLGLDRILLDMSADLEGSLRHSVLYSVVCCALLGAIYWCRIKRRLKNG